MKSIVQSRRECWICRRYYNIVTVRGLECHHIFDGPRRAISDREGLTVYLCHPHHNEPPGGVHFNRAAMLALQFEAEMAYDALHEPGACAKLMGKQIL